MTKKLLLYIDYELTSLRGWWSSQDSKWSSKSVSLASRGAAEYDTSFNRFQVIADAGITRKLWLVEGVWSGLRGLEWNRNSSESDTSKRSWIDTNWSLVGLRTVYRLQRDWAEELKRDKPKPNIEECKEKCGYFRHWHRRRQLRLQHEHGWLSKNKTD